MDLKEYIKEEYLTVNYVTQLSHKDREALILPIPAEWTPASKDFKETESKPSITISVRPGGDILKCRLSKKVARDLAMQLNSTNTDDWAGAIVALDIKNKGTISYVVLRVIKQPEKRL